MKQFSSVLTAMVLVSLCGCGSAKQAASPIPVARQQATFDYTPKKTTKVGSSNITIALVDPVYVTKNTAFVRYPFNQMAKSMGNDFEELLTAKGFKIRGPFNGMGSMLYTDKQNSDFIFAVDIDLLVGGRWETIAKAKKNWGNIIGNSLSNENNPTENYTYTFNGSGTIGGNLNITAMSPSFGEKLWKKNITLEQLSFSFVGNKVWATNRVSIYDLISQDDNAYNAFVKELQKFYLTTFELVEAQIDPEEMKGVAAEAKKAEKKN